MVNPCGSSDPLSVAEEVVICWSRFGRYDGASSRGKRGKGPVASIPGSCRIDSHDAEMISSARTQAADVDPDILVRVLTLALGRGCESVAGRCSILEMNGGGQSVRVNRAVQSGRKTGHIRRGISRDNSRTCRGKRG